MTDDELARLEELAGESTPGPWRSEQGPTHAEVRAPHQTARSVARVYCDIDAAFIVASRDAAPALVAEVRRMKDAIRQHHAYHADDRCIEDDDALYAAAGLPPCDRRVGDKAAMLRNCERFVTQRCEGGGPWRTYEELEKDNARLYNLLAETFAVMRHVATGSDYWDSDAVGGRTLAAVEQCLREKQ